MLWLAQQKLEMSAEASPYNMSGVNKLDGIANYGVWKSKMRR